MDIRSHDTTRLPNEIMSLILNHLIKQQRPAIIHEIDEQQATLFQCTLVSRQLYAIANPLLWEAPILNGRIVSTRFHDCLLNITTSRQRIATIGQHICKLQLKYHLWSDRQLVDLLPHLPHLTHLVLHSSYISDNSFRYLPRHCQQLGSIDLQCIRLTKKPFVAIGKYCRRLVDFSWMVLGTQSLGYLDALTYCPLESLRLHLDWNHINDNIFTNIATFDRLTSLEIEQYPPEPALPITGPHTIPSHLFPQLKKLSLDPCTMDDTTMMAFVSSHRELQELYLRHAKLLTDATLDAIACWLPLVTRVTLTSNRHITLNTAHRLIRQCRRLDYINVHGCDCVMANDWDGVTFGQLQIDKIRGET